MSFISFILNSVIFLLLQHRQELRTLTGFRGAVVRGATFRNLPKTFQRRQTWKRLGEASHSHS